VRLRRLARAPRGPILSILLLIPGSIFAVVPTLWTMETFEDFEKGKPDGIAVAAAGELTLAPALRPMKIPPLEETAEPFLWSQAVDAKGTLYVGAGTGGRIYRVPRGASGALYFETGDLAVHALAVDRSDVLYAATSPQGKIYRVTGEAKGEVYYQPEDRYVWSLAFSPKGDLYASTGEHGSIYKLTGKGKAEVVLRSEEPHIVCLAFDPAGNLYAGSDGKGLLYKISPQGKASVAFDSPLREISAVVVDPRGPVYAAAIGLEGEPPGPLLQPQPAPPGKQGGPGAAPVSPLIPIPGVEGGASTTITVTASVSGAPPQPAGPLPKSEVYRVDPDGTVTTIWSSSNEAVYALTLDSAGRPLIGSGEPGRIRMLPGSLQNTLLARLPESQVTSLGGGPGQPIFVTSSNVGKAYALDSSSADTGTYLSPPRDTQSVSRWGRIAWRATVPGGGRVEIATRSGNSSLPDSTWSDWSAGYANAEGSPVASPPARYLQWRARLTRPGAGASPSISAVSIAYVQTNQPPALRKVSLLPPGVIRERQTTPQETDPQDLAFTGIRVRADLEPSPGTTQSGRKIYARGMRGVEWEADDPNGDTLAYDLSFKGEGESAWKPMARGLRDGYFAFDSTQLPDGLYRLRVEATDEPSNPGSQAKAASIVSEPFLVDNTPPAVQVTVRKGAKGPSFSIEVSASDGQGPLGRAEYSIDGGRWVTLLPVDGISDSRAESYSVALEAPRAGEHTVIVKVTDLLGNTGAGKTTFSSE
jgi:WD40 repeat protein